MRSRVPAGGDATVQNCYLKQTLLPEANPGAMAYNWQPSAAQWPPNPEVRYTGGVPIMFESGTMGQPLPDIMYGCPYPPVASGVCTVPPPHTHFPRDQNPVLSQHHDLHH